MMLHKLQSNTMPYGRVSEISIVTAERPRRFCPGRPCVDAHIADDGKRWQPWWRETI